MDYIWVLKKPVISEKSLSLAKDGKFTFEVDKKAGKREIANAIQKHFGVNVESVRTINIHREIKRVGKRRQNRILSGGAKKAIVKLAKDQKIDLFEIEKK